MTPPACPSRTSLRTPWCLPGGLLRASAPSRACFGRHRFPSTHLGTHTFVWQCETNNGGGRKERGRGQSLRKGVSWSAAQAGASLFMFPPVLESSYCAPSLLLMYEATRPHLYSVSSVHNPKPRLPLTRAPREAFLAQADPEAPDAGAHVGAFRHCVRSVRIGPGASARPMFRR